MLGASRSNSSACSTMAACLDNNRGIGLYGEPAVLAFVRIEDWLQQASGFDRDFTNQLPADLFFGRGGPLLNQRTNAVLP